jgi:hypothetical protein
MLTLEQEEIRVTLCEAAEEAIEKGISRELVVQWVGEFYDYILKSKPSGQH